MTIEKQISPFVSSQFPEFYQEEGPNFIAFVKAYYQWMESANNVIYDSRRLQEYSDIDLTVDRFVEMYRKQYMLGMPKTMATNTKFFLKKVLDLYRSKGTARSYEIFFRAVFDVDVKLYMPGQDVLRLSAGEWNIPQYLEVSDSGILTNMEGMQIYGSGSGAKAIVESYVVQQAHNKVVNILNLSSVRGQFDTGEFVNIVGNTVFTDAPRVLGSLVSVGIKDGGTNFSVGDILNVAGKGVGAKAKITSIYSENGKVAFTLVNGGSGYTLSSLVSVTGGSGTGASFAVGGLVDKSILNINTDLITDYLLTTLNAANYNFPKVNSPDVEDINSTILAAFTTIDVEIGTIQYLTRINPGVGYSSNPIATVVEPLIVNLLLSDGMGGFKGNNAVVTAEASSANGIAGSAAIVDSGIGYEKGELLTLSVSTNPTSITAGSVVRNHGFGQGSWADTKGFLDSDKFIQDSNFFQDFSYEVQTPIEFDRYKDVVKQLIHPAGMAIFGKYSAIDEQVNRTVMLSNSAFSAINEDAELWTYAVQAGGGSVSSAQMLRISTFLSALAATGTYDIIDDMWMLASENANQALTSLKQRRLATAISSPTFVANGGYSFTGSSYIDTGFIATSHATSMNLTSIMATSYERTDVAALSPAIGVEGGTGILTLYPKTGSGVLSSKASSTLYTGDTMADSRGLSSAFRNGASTWGFYKNGAATGVPAVAPTNNGTTAPDLSIFIGCRNLLGTPSNFRASTQGFAAVGKYRTVAQEAALYAAIQVYMTAIGANV